MRLVKYTPGGTRRRIALIVFWTALGIRLALLALGFAGYAVMGNTTLELIQFVILIAAFFLVRSRRTLLYGLLILGLLLNTALFLLRNDGAEYRFTSPQRTNALVIREHSSLISSGTADVYSRAFGVLLNKLDLTVGAGENYTLYPSGQYRVAWDDESTAKLTYYDGYAYRELTIPMN